MSRIFRQLKPRLPQFAIPARQFSTETISNASNKIQVYRSTSDDPFINLSIEHHLLQNTPAESTILLLYTNAPCIVFGRNQNPWLEVNLPRLAQIKFRSDSVGWKDRHVQLVRRRSGGGTVFHDGGNVNFSVICPPAVFDRDKHAEMVVRALKTLGRPNSRVNERHDIVVDVSSSGTFKISGSAYKLTRLRSLHHGTCLLRSPNLSNISGMLRSPAEPFIKARGVDSVRSPVRNVDIDNADFEKAVVEEFADMYGQFDVQEEVGERALEIENVKRGYEELKSRSWIYGQTPRFTFSTSPSKEDPRERPPLPFDINLSLEAKNGVISHFSLEGAKFFASRTAMTAFLDRPIYEIADWSSRLKEAGMDFYAAEDIGSWMNDTLGTEFTRS